jgi:hypothetical protein
MRGEIARKRRGGAEDWQAKPIERSQIRNARDRNASGALAESRQSFCDWHTPVGQRGKLWSRIKLPLTAFPPLLGMRHEIRKTRRQDGAANGVSESVSGELK